MRGGGGRRGGTEFRRLRTPRAAAVAGIAFGALFATSIVLLGTSLPADTATPWVHNGSRIAAALTLAPLAGIAFLWFLGVLRDRLGTFEDRFFATVALGSGLLFLATTFTSMALAGGILAVSRDVDSGRDGTVTLGRIVMLHLNNVYGVRMAGVFMISLGTIWLRTGLMPRWLAIATYLLALTLLVVVSFSFWVTLIFPVWAVVISVYVLTSPTSSPGAEAV
ncbi:hypothetical protein [Rhodococcus sp. NPDC059234]|uniref:hypothetical protein n=1 Tax=Rhodococcus sp. NPDC059234 TaxID=3346781 RepID=UPI00366F8E91